MTAVLRALGLSALVALAAAAPVDAAYFPGQPVDGPTADITELSGVTLSRDSDGHVLYLRREGGANHVFVSFLAAGNPRQPRRLDTGQVLPSSQARISSADNGRAVAVWVNGGSLWSSVRPTGSSDWGSPQAVYSVTPTGADVEDPSLSMGPSGAAYVAFEVDGDLRVARLSGSNWTLVDGVIDMEPARDAGDVDLATSADGTAIAAFEEAGHVYERRIIRTRLSSVPQEVGVPSLDGRAAGAASSPSIEIEDDSSYAWVTVKQDFDGGSRVFARRLVGSEFEAPVPIDTGRFGVAAPTLDMTGRGRGLAAIPVGGTNAVIGATLGSDNQWDPSEIIAADSPVPSAATSALAENGRGTIAWQSPSPAGAPWLVARHWNARRFEEPATLSDPTLGPLDAARGIDAAGDSFGNVVVAYVQGDGVERRLMVAAFDREPRAVGGSNFDDWTRKRSFKLKWGRVEDPWGGIQYRVELDGVPIAQTASTSMTARNLPDGAHEYTIYAIDSRGQTSEGPNRALYVDTTAPTVELTARSSKMGRPANIELSAFDGEAIAGSGVKTVSIRYGDGGRSGLTVPRIGLVDGAKLGYRYRKPGRYTVRVEVRDVAGNKKTATARVVVRR
jgi:hypothetical protein